MPIAPRTAALSEGARARFAEHRRRALARMPADSAMLLFGAPHYIRNADTEFPYRQHSDLWYLSGWGDADVALLLLPGHEAPFQLFVQPRDKEREIWTGYRPGPEGAVEIFGADAAHPWGELDERLPALLTGRRVLYYEAFAHPGYDRRVARALAAARRPAGPAGAPLPESFTRPGAILHPLRLRKTEAELLLLREAARITADAHRAVMAMSRPGVREYELAARLEYEFRSGGGAGPGYQSIVGSGENACVLHYVSNRDALREGDLVLVDAGCELECYTADVTRTFPASGRFSDAQRAVYEVVLQAQLAAIAAARPGGRYDDVHDAAVRALTEGCVRLGLLEGEVDALIEEKAYRRFYMHGTSHWLGLDVHDVGAYHAGGESLVFEPGMVLTVEPGLYIDPEDEEVPEAFRGIGIRIEDDVLVTGGDPEVLTSAAPKTIAEVEAAVGVAV